MLAPSGGALYFRWLTWRTDGRFEIASRGKPNLAEVGYAWAREGAVQAPLPDFDREERNESTNATGRSGRRGDDFGGQSGAAQTLGFSEPSDPHHRAAGGRFRHRHPRAHPGKQAERASGPAGRGRESSGRQCDHRHRRRRQGRAGRLYAGLRPGQFDHHQHLHLQESALQPLRDFAPITQTTANPLGAIANPASGIKSLKDVVARAKAEPGKLNYGSFGVGK